MEKQKVTASEKETAKLQKKLEKQNAKIKEERGKLQEILKRKLKTEYIKAVKVQILFTNETIDCYIGALVADYAKSYIIISSTFKELCIAKVVSQPYDVDFEKDKELMEKIWFHESSSKAEMCTMIMDMSFDGKAEFINELTNMLLLSDDGKTVKQYFASKNDCNRTVMLPDSVEAIDNDVFKNEKIKKLYINKNLKKLGRNKLCNGNEIEIIIDEDNTVFCQDEKGFYENLSSGKKKLLLYKYTTEQNIIDLSEDIEIVASNALSATKTDKTKKKIYIHENIKDIESDSNNFEEIELIIDEKNPYLFRDEDSIYKVLDDGSFELISCRYTGKGRLLILDNTTRINKSAFVNCKFDSQLQNWEELYY